MKHAVREASEGGTEWLSRGEPEAGGGSHAATGLVSRGAAPGSRSSPVVVVVSLPLSPSSCPAPLQPPPMDDDGGSSLPLSLQPALRRPLTSSPLPPSLLQTSAASAAQARVRSPAGPARASFPTADVLATPFQSQASRSSTRAGARAASAMSVSTELLLEEGRRADRARPPSRPSPGSRRSTKTACSPGSKPRASARARLAAPPSASCPSTRPPGQPRSPTHSSSSGSPSAPFRRSSSASAPSSQGPSGSPSSLGCQSGRSAFTSP